ARAIASVRAPAIPSRANSRTAACKMAVRVSSGRPRDPRRGRAGGLGMVGSLLTNQLVRLYKADTGWAKTRKGLRCAESFLVRPTLFTQPSLRKVRDRLGHPLVLR